MSRQRERITHLCLGNFYVDNHSYQENLLPKYHKREGHDVRIIASLFTFDTAGQPNEVEAPCEYLNEHGIPVKRVGYRRAPFARRLRLFRGTYRSIRDARPSVLFVHGPQFLDALFVFWFLRRYPKVRCYVDNHADFGNSATNWFSHRILHRIVWRFCAKLLSREAERFYGVLPARVSFLKDVYGIRENLLELLPLGADDALVEAVRNRPKQELRNKYGLPLDVVVIATGGKINIHRPEMLNLLESVQRSNRRFEVVVFGSVSPAYKSRFERLIDNERIHYLGWLGAQESLEVMAAADVVMFPGKHSVLWEQACALGAPLIVRDLAGTEHLDLGGNCLRLQRGDTNEIRTMAEALVDNPRMLSDLATAAATPAREAFLYGTIARRSIA